MRMTAKLNFVRQQGFRDASPQACDYQNRRVGSNLYSSFWGVRGLDGKNHSVRFVKEKDRGQATVIRYWGGTDVVAREEV